MARNNCVWCCNYEEIARNPETFKAAVLWLLCQIAGSNPGGFGVILPQYTRTFDQIPAGYTTLPLLDSTFQLSQINISNQTDANIEISLDGGATTEFVAPANTYTTRNLGSWTGTSAASLQYRSQSGTTPTIGTIYFDGSY